MTFSVHCVFLFLLLVTMFGSLQAFQPLVHLSYRRANRACMSSCTTFTSTTRMMASVSSRVPSGLCAVHKPKGVSSAFIVSKIKRMLQDGIYSVSHRKVNIRVGHGGTLDPLAEGVLVLGIGDGTKMLASYLAGSKEYRGVAKLGFATDTLDSLGKTTKEVDCAHVDKECISSVLPRFTGEISQKPPMFSALKHNGLKLYELARKGIEVERKARNITVYKLDLVGYNYPEFELLIESSGGCYVRSIIDDIGSAVNGAAHMSGLVRSKQGPFRLADCLTEDQWNFDSLRRHIVKCTEIVDPLPPIDKRKLEWRRLENQ